MFALDYQLDRIMEEGMENRFKRHEEMAKYVRNWAKEYFELLPQEIYASNTVTTIKNTRNIDISDLNKKLGEKGFVISNGYGKLKDKTFRIAHMADCTLSEIHEVISTLNEVLGL
jgi:aspartate aminotransferase-like enzyme